MEAMRVLVACEFSGTVRTAFRTLGHDAWSVDLLPTEYEPEYHIQGDVLRLLSEKWDLLIAHPPCTYLTNAGVRHFHSNVASVNGRTAEVCGDARKRAMVEAAAFFKQLLDAPVPRIAVENPTPHRYARLLIGDYDQAIQPWQFGHGETKRTCLWLKNLPKLVPTELVIGREQRVHMTSPSTERWKERSRTYPGIAAAMAEQWGSL